MIPGRRLIAFLALTSLALLPEAWAGPVSSARGWLRRMDDAPHHTSYIGTFVYRHGSRLETMRIYHEAGLLGVKERLQSLNGEPREIIRSAHGIRCYLPNQHTILIQRAHGAPKTLPVIPPTHLSDLARYYQFRLGGEGRVAGRLTQIVLIEPRDQDRYGYRLWADLHTGILLRTDLLDPEGQVVEQFMFTRFEQVKRVASADLRAPHEKDAQAWHREGPEQRIFGSPDWVARDLPPGFSLEMRLQTTQPSGAPVQHYVYSDGLAAVSVFAQKTEGEPHRGLMGLHRMGAVHVFGRFADGWQITAIGEVPAAVVTTIAQSFVRQK